MISRRDFLRLTSGTMTGALGVFPARAAPRL